MLRERAALADEDASCGVFAGVRHAQISKGDKE
jgi:hypothetical protein